MLYFLAGAMIVIGLPTVCFADRDREYRKFLAGGFFVGWRIRLYLCAATVSVPLRGTGVVFTPGPAACAPSFISSCSLFACISAFSRSPQHRRHRQLSRRGS